MKRRTFFRNVLNGALAVMGIHSLTRSRHANAEPKTSLTSTLINSEGSMFVHSVYFWLKPDLSSKEKSEFTKGLKSLTTIETVRDAYIGTPASTSRPIIDRTYSYALILAFDNKEDHDVYQEHPVHDEFRTLENYWLKVQIYDAVTE